MKEELLELKKEHSVLYEYLDSHTFEVELVRQHARSQDPVAEKVFFAVSSDVLEVVSGSHFREHAQVPCLTAFDTCLCPPISQPHPSVRASSRMSVLPLIVRRVSFCRRCSSAFRGRTRQKRHGLYCFA